MFFYHNLKLHEMIDIHSQYDNMHTNGIFNALICINNRVNSCINCMLSVTTCILCLQFYNFEVNLIYNLSNYDAY